VPSLRPRATGPQPAAALRPWCRAPLALTVGLFLLAGQAGGQANERKKATYLPHWVPQAQFAGYYMAVEKGLYRDRGVDITVLRGVPEQPATSALAHGDVDFITTFLSTALQRLDEGVDLVNIGQIVQRSALLLVTRASSGIKTPADFAGRTVSVWPEFALQPRALFRKFGVQPRIITQRNTLNLFLRGGADVASAMLYNEYHLLLNAGLEDEELTVFRYDAYGLNFPEDGIYCLRSTLARDPALARAFVQGSLVGWRYAFEHPEEALDVVMRHVRAAGLPTSRVHHRWMLAHMRDIMAPSGDLQALGALNAEDFANVVRELQAAGLLKRVPDLGAFHVDCTR
jgi:NitT/TauT family transport system substrate-binding protein